MKSRCLAAFSFLLAALSLSGTAHGQALEQPNLKLMLDWAVQGTHAPFFLAEKRGYFKQEGFQSVAIDRGNGAGAVINAVAGGAYHMGLSDMPVLVKFNAQNPARALTAFYMYFDETPLCLVSLSDKNPIRIAADLNGKRVAAPAGAAIISTMPILLKATKQEHAKVSWVTTSPDLMPVMLMRGDADAVGGFTNSMIMAVRAMGVKQEQLSVFKYSDAGIDMYGLALMAPQPFIRDNPRTVAAFTRAINRAIRDTIADPKAAIAVLKDRDPLINADVELERLQIALVQVVTAKTRKDGLSSVTAERLKRTIDTVAQSEALPNLPKVEDIFTDRFLPSAADRAIPKTGS